MDTDKKKFDEDMIKMAYTDINHLSWILQTDAELDILDQGDYQSREFCETVHRVRDYISTYLGAENVNELVDVIAKIEKHIKENNLEEKIKSLKGNGGIF